MVYNKHTDERDIPVPCGKCYDCIQRRVQQWAFRLNEELDNSEAAHFITLTYDTKYVPISKGGYMNLDREDVQKFLKRLRKKSELPIKYLYSGEYGTQKERPHYHMCIFNAYQEDIESSWQLGEIHYGNIEEASCQYTMKYLSKPPIRHAFNDDRLKEYTNMSKGIGLSYLTPQMVKWHRADSLNRLYCTTINNVKIAMPQYYRKRIWTEEEREEMATKLTLKQAGLFYEQQDELIELHGQRWEDVFRDIQLNKFSKMHKKAQKADLF